MAEAPLSAEEIAHRGFPSSFRGFDPAEVRTYLVRVANELRAATARERELQQKLMEAERRAANPVIDQAMLTRALGEETSRVLASAQEAARQLQARAEEGAARILREAHEQAQRIRAAAEVVLADRTEEADAEAGQIRAAGQVEAGNLLEHARKEAEAARAEVADQARQMVQEAQAARARVLGDLARRRRIAHTQVEQLRAGRERLLDAYRVVRRTLDEVADELERVESEARSAAGAAARRAEAALEDAGASTPERAGQADAASPAGDLNGERGEVAASAPAETPAPTAPAVLAPIAAAEPSSEPAPPPASASTTSSTHRSNVSSRETPVVAREERAEERKLSSLRILRRPKSAGLGQGEAPGARSSELEGVRVIPAEPARGEPPSPSHIRSGPAEPSVMPGVSWAPAPPAPSPPAPVAAVVAGAGTPGPKDTVDTAVGEALPRPMPAPVEPEEAEAEAEVEVETISEAGSPSPPSSPVDALFARIRADRTKPESEAVSAPVAIGSESPPDALVEAAASPPAPPVPEAPAEKPNGDEVLLQQRDAALEVIEASLTRKLKRALQDEHNDVLDRLRSVKGVPTSPSFLPSSAEQEDRYAASAGELLQEAARSGSRFAAPGAGEGAAFDVADVIAELTGALVGLLRRGVERGMEGTVEDPSVLVDCIGATYRECKSQRLEGLASDAAIAAFSRGTAEASAGSHLRWVVDDGETACPDCDDNALAGATPSGQLYPTGQSHPPAHAGCRCLLVPERP